MAFLRQGARESRPDDLHAELTVSVPASLEAGAALRRAVRALDRWLGDDATAEDVELLVTELAANGVKHSQTGDCNRITLDARVDPKGLRVAVRDCGKGFEPRPRERERTEPGGWGLVLVEDIADSWGVEDDPSTTVWFELARAA